MKISPFYIFQGNECDEMLLDSRSLSFVHGLICVGLTRVRDSSKIATFTKIYSLFIDLRKRTAEVGNILPTITKSVIAEPSGRQILV